MPPIRAIGFEVKTLTNLIRQQINQSPLGQEMEELTGIQGWIIGFLYENQTGDLYQRDIEARFKIRRSTVTGVLQRMERSGLIRRESVAQDARLKKLVLTEKAVRLHKRVIQELQAIELRLRTGLTDEELDLFFTLMERMKQNMVSSAVSHKLGTGNSALQSSPQTEERIQ